jgi:geranylgeranyl diphosphate synthase type I
MTATEANPHWTPAHEVLAWSQRHLQPGLRAAIDTLPDDMRRIASYHFGWWDEHGHALDGQGGKALRPALVLLAAEAVGGTAASALPAAVAVELVHNFSLLHDDLMDQDVTRRHRPTAWKVFGASAAILVGDALSALATDVLAASDHPAALPGVRVLNAAVQDLIQGQIMDVAFERRTGVDLAECQQMAHAKTAALIGGACALGVLYGQGGDEQVRALRSFGHALGLAFQHIDDLLGIWGDPAITGKPSYSDLRGRKKTLPIVAALNSGSPSGSELAARYHRDGPLSDADLTTEADLIDSAGGRAFSQDQADQLAAQARHHLRSAHLTARTAELEALAHLATSRDQ